MKSPADILGRLRSANRRPDRPAEPDAERLGVDLLDPQVLAQISSYELIAKSVVDGVMSGKHRSTHRGGCTEQVDHRPYSQGDETRLIDWRLFARRDRHYVKLFADETNLKAWIAVDGSSSMDYGDSTVSKSEYAARACACLGRLLLRQRDSVGLLVNRGKRWAAVPPRSQASQFRVLCQSLAQRTRSGADGALPLLGALPQLAKRRGMIVLFSDCFGNLDALTQSLKRLRVSGHDVIVFQVLAPEEIHFRFRQAALFKDLEGGAKQRVEPVRMRARYLERFRAHQDRLKAELTSVGCDLCTLATDEDLGAVLSRFLGYRANCNATLVGGGSARGTL